MHLIDCRELTNGVSNQAVLPSLVMLHLLAGYIKCGLIPSIELF